MAQNKKKPSAHQLLKLTIAHHKKEFFRRLRQLINMGNSEDIYSLLPAGFLEEVYQTRCRSAKVERAPGADVPQKILDDLQVYLTHHIKNEVITISDEGHKITIHEYLTLGFTILAMHTRLENDKIPQAKKIRDALNLFVKSEKIYMKVMGKLYPFLVIISSSESDLSKRLYWITRSFRQVKGSLGILNLMEVHSFVPESKNVEINGLSRPVIPMVWAYPEKGPEYIQIKPSALWKTKNLSVFPHNVYIQAHALQRLAERVDCSTVGLVQYFAFLSLNNPRIVYDDNNILIECYFLEVKVGYFLADLIKRDLVIRTFLFITNNGTPEGKKLAEITGLQKLDKKYLAIDKLSTFINSDIGKNEKLQEIFQAAECESILYCYRELKHMVMKNNNANPLKILQYLEYEKPEEEVENLVE